MIDFILISAEKTINKNIIRFNCNVIPNNKTVYIYIDVDTGVVLKSSYPEGSFLEGSMRNFVMEIYELSQDDTMLKNVDLMNRLLSKKPVFCDVLPIETAPKGGGAEMVTDPDYAEPPKILLFFKNGESSIGYWDWCYAEGGRCYDGGEAWIEPVSGERLDMHYDAPVGWMPIPKTEDKLASQKANL